LPEGTVTAGISLAALVALIAILIVAVDGGPVISAYVVVGGGLLAVTWVAVAAAYRSTADRGLTLILTGGCAAKLFVGPPLRQAAADQFYKGLADPYFYFAEGRVIGRWYRSGHVSLRGIQGLEPRALGNNLVRVAGVVLAVIGDSKVGFYLVFSWLSFLGLWCLVEAVRRAFPDRPVKRYALALCFLPSLLYWPSTAGKEAWMMCCIGLATLGVSLLVSESGRTPVAIVLMVSGLAGAAWVRPHIAALLVAGIVAALVHLMITQRSAHTWRLLLAALVVLAPTAVFVSSEFSTVFGGRSSYTDVIDYTAARTDTGGSTFHATPVRTPADLPGAAVTVLLRPFPWEADNGQMLITSAETSLVALGVPLLAWRWRRWLGALRRSPFLAFVLVYVTGFVAAFASIGNFGILARERTMVWGLVLVGLVVIGPTRSDGGAVVTS
jgi:hypothetical protein